VGILVSSSTPSPVSQPATSSAIPFPPEEVLTLLNPRENLVFKNRCNLDHAVLNFLRTGGTKCDSATESPGRLFFSS
jgi:hypothetical protein